MKIRISNNTDIPQFIEMSIRHAIKRGYLKNTENWGNRYHQNIQIFDFDREKWIDLNEENFDSDEIIEFLENPYKSRIYRLMLALAKLYKEEK